jgi:uncharacterized delta-60 repeat protein
VIEQVEGRRYLSSVSASPTANAGTAATLNLSTAGSNAPTAIHVNFGDGTSASLAGSATSTTHQFATAGSFMPTVTVTDANGTHSPLALGLDPSFATNGIKLETGALQWGEAHTVLVQTVNGTPMLLVGGWAYTSSLNTLMFAVARYNLNGSLDTTFGTSGIAMTGLVSTWSQATSIALDHQGRIVLVGGDDAAPQIIVARLTANGAVDTTFGTGGVFATNIGGGGGATGVVVAADDSLYVNGYAYDNSTSYYTLVRITSSGTLDTTWGDGGYVRPSLGLVTYWEYSTAMAVDSAGNLVVGGWKLWGGLDGWNFALARFTPDGSLDSTFGTGGVALTDFDCRDDGANALAIQADGKIVVAGQTSDWYAPNDDRIYHFAVARYNANGTPDTTFGGVGQNPGCVTLKLGDPTKDSLANAIAIQSDGSILVAGSSYVDYG